MKNILLIVALGLVVAGVYLYRENGAPTNTLEWESYSNSVIGFSVEKPKDATVDIENEGRSVKIMFLGPDALPNTEITDGFTFTVTKDGVVSAMSLKAYAEERIGMVETNGGKVEEELALVEVKGMEAYKYSFTTILGNVANEYVFLTSNKEGYIINTSVYDPNSEGYATMIDRMIKSFSITSNNYIGVFDWPPVTRFVAEPYSCVEAGSTTERAGETRSQTINGREYCVTKIVEGAAGSMYTQYAYATPANNGTAILTFSTRASQCANYPEEEQGKCRTAQENFDPNPTIDILARNYLSSL